MNEIQLQDQGADLLHDVVKPKIYSSRAVWGFSFLFTPLFGGILLMQNLRDIGREKKGTAVLMLSILMTALTIALLTVFDIDNRAVSFALNGAFASILTQYFYKKDFPDEAHYGKKKIWKPLIIGVLIFTCFLVLALLAAQDNQLQ